MKGWVPKERPRKKKKSRAAAAKISVNQGIIYSRSALDIVSELHAANKEPDVCILCPSCADCLV